MLPEVIVEELTRPTPLQRLLVETAWPSLNTVERLQILARSTSSDWMVALAMQDEHAIVRFWGARSYCGSSRSLIRGGKFVYLSREEVPLDETGQKIAVDPCKLVSLLVDDTPYSQATQLSRLVRLRARNGSFLSNFVGWIDSAIKAGLSDSDAAECAYEYFECPNVKRDIERMEMPEWAEPYDHYLAGESLSGLWRVFSQAGRELQTQLLYRLPFAYWGHRVSSDEVVNLPEEALIDVMRVYNEQPTVAKIREQILEHPEHYSPSLVKAVQELMERRGASWPPAPKAMPTDSQQRILEELHSMRQDLAEMRKELAEGRAAAPRKWFG